MRFATAAAGAMEKMEMARRKSLERLIPAMEMERSEAGGVE
jgi:hypothetical protein